MTYDDALARLLALVGRELEVTAFDTDSESLALSCSGLLAEGQDVSGGGDLDDEAWTFMLEGGAGTFHLDRAAFRSANGDTDGLTIEQGSVRLLVPLRDSDA